MKNYRVNNQGFTVVELLVTLMVSSIILCAVATLAFAISSANSGSDDISQKQMRIRFAQIQLKELIQNCKMICNATATDIAIWRSDDDNDNEIDTGELVYIDAATTVGSLKIMEFENSVGSSLGLSQIRSGAIKGWLITNMLKRQSVIFDDCQNVSFGFDVAPPRSSIATVKFEYSGPDGIKKYEISSKMICDSSYLLTSANELVVLDDD
jgi:prepilin-type N-terminal cleavage/methylation domain-containing protein